MKIFLWYELSSEGARFNVAITAKEEDFRPTATDPCSEYASHRRAARVREGERRVRESSSRRTSTCLLHRLHRVLHLEDPTLRRPRHHVRVVLSGCDWERKAGVRGANEEARRIRDGGNRQPRLNFDSINREIELQTDRQTDRRPGFRVVVLVGSG